MFTNWLTGTSGGNANGNSNNDNNNNNNNNSNSTHEDRVRNSIANLGLPSNSNSTPSSSSSSSIMSTPPDVILEVGPAPSVRFVAHSIVLGMHSGYLRSAIRLDEQHQQQQHQQQANSAVSVGGVHHKHTTSEFLLYLSNVTAEQFAPLLTYMYTGYLDLNVENIFGVLLATHVLHMPRALEICRSFLARAQTEGYFNNNLPSLPTASTNSSANANHNNNNPTTNSNNKNNGKIIRPIPSKATLPNFGFLPAHLTLQQHQQSQLSINNNATSAINCFKSLQQQLAYVSAGSSGGAGSLLIEQQAREQLREYQQQQQQKESIESKPHEHDRGEEIVVDNSNSPRNDFALRTNETENDDDEEVEVYIDSLSETENEVEHERRMRRRREAVDSEDEREIVVTNDDDNTIQPTQKQQPQKTPQKSTQKSSTSNKQKQHNKSATTQQQKREKRSRRNRNTSSSCGLQVAKAPIPASQLDIAESSKVIIDVASCDGPVRFRRILNTAYGHKPDTYAPPTLPERTQQSVSLSFHQQMAKTISQQRQLQHAEESENSESSGGGGSTHGNGAKQGSKSSSATTTSNEIYVCVYCKHSFKSQYCYQKHAKRHLNPLSLNCVRGAGHNSSNNNNDIKLSSQCQGKLNADLPATLPLPLPLVTSAVGKQNASDLLRREVRPLDMNVQYYPCKTCGSKFPSYYFVHKHRKMCHADEEANEASSERGRETTERAKSTGATSEDEKADDNVGVEDITRKEANKSNE